MFTQTAWHFDVAVEKAKEAARMSGQIKYLVFVSGTNNWRIFDTVAPEQQRRPYFSVSPSGLVRPHEGVAPKRR
jgi:hypothetical protein